MISPVKGPARADQGRAAENSVPVPWVVIVGGFLGAGKTTLLMAAAHELAKRGLRSAIVLNDQSEGLVDTQYAELNGLPSGEVTGGCFCCRFSDLMHALDRMRAHRPNVIFGEPVGSCTDISATLLHPLEEYATLYRLAPYTVLVDPERARQLMRDNADQHLAFLFRKQLAEADLVCFTKSDLNKDTPEIGALSVRQISAKTGQGVAAWLDEVLQGTVPAGKTILDIDYEQYARAEAALAWLNLRAIVRTVSPRTPASVLGPLLDSIDLALTRVGIEIVHLKAIVRAETGFVKAAICGNGLEPTVEGMLDASPALQHDVLLNLRCVGNAEVTKFIVERSLEEQSLKSVDLYLQAFHPAAPNPERRMTKGEVATRSIAFPS